MSAQWGGGRRNIVVLRNGKTDYLCNSTCLRPLPSLCRCRKTADSKQICHLLMLPQLDGNARKMQKHIYFLFFSKFQEVCWGPCRICTKIKFYVGGESETYKSQTQNTKVAKAKAMLTQICKSIMYDLHWSFGNP